MSSPIALENLLGVISPEKPCGEDAWLWVEASIKPLIEVRPPAQPNWNEVARRCERAFRGEKIDGVDSKGGKDLRLAVILTRALTAINGIEGVRDGLALIRELLERFAPYLYPISPGKRASVLEWLCPTDGGITDIRQPMLRAPLTIEWQNRAFSMRDIEVATGKRTASNGEAAATTTDVDAAFSNTEPDRIHALRNIAQDASGQIDAIRTLIARSGIAPGSPPLSPLKEVIDGIVLELAGRSGVQHASSPPAATPPPTPEASQKPSSTVASPPPTVRPGINSRSDAVNALDLLCAYYRGQEPSSPVIYLLDQARNWVGKSYLEIYSDLIPDPSDKGKTLLLAIRTKDKDKPK